MQSSAYAAWRSQSIEQAGRQATLLINTPDSGGGFASQTSQLEGSAPCTSRLPPHDLLDAPLVVRSIHNGKENIQLYTGTAETSARPAISNDSCTACSGRAACIRNTNLHAQTYTAVCCSSVYTQSFRVAR